jgi:hypothetical protein
LFKKNVLILFSTVFFSSSVFAQKPWDILRPISAIASELDFYTRFLIMFLALGFFAVSALAVLRNRSTRLAVVSIAFGLFAFKSTVKVIDLFFGEGWFFPQSSENVVEVLILALLFCALFVKR